MLLNIYGYSNTGKTELVTNLIKALSEKGLSVASVKHIPEEGFSIDEEGKDTWKHSKAGAELVVAYSRDETAFIMNENLVTTEIADIIKKIADSDVILVEGSWDDISPKVALGDIQERPNTVFKYRDNFDDILAFILNEIDVESILTKLPGLDCKKCGNESCKDLARAIHDGKNAFEDCYYHSEKMVSLRVDNKDIPLGKFAREIIEGTITGMVSSLKGVEEGRNIKIEIRE